MTRQPYCLSHMEGSLKLCWKNHKYLTCMREFANMYYVLFKHSTVIISFAPWSFLCLTQASQCDSQQWMFFKDGFMGVKHLVVIFLSPKYDQFFQKSTYDFVKVLKLEAMMVCFGFLLFLRSWFHAHLIILHLDVGADGAAGKCRRTEQDIGAAFGCWKVYRIV